LNDLSPKASSTLAVAIAKLQRTCVGRARIETSSESLPQEFDGLSCTSPERKMIQHDSMMVPFYTHKMLLSCSIPMISPLNPIKPHKLPWDMMGLYQPPGPPKKAEQIDDSLR